jgi:gliding motility-associated-like protein
MGVLGLIFFVFIDKRNSHAYEITPNIVEENIFEAQGTYDVTLIATNELGCTDTTTQTIKIDNPLVMYVPNAFTPDGDALNNDFKPVLSSGFDPYNYELIVFNRWGEIMFVLHNAEVGWDGTYGGKLCPEGLYVWQIRVKNGNGTFEAHRGHLSLLR